MQYIALLRGINVGGNNKVEMSRLKTLFKDLDFEDVKTHINSGNVIFSSKHKDLQKLTKQVTEAISSEFKLDIPVLIKTKTQLKKIVDAIPSSWQNNSEIKCDVLFLWDEFDSVESLKSLNLNPENEGSKYIPGAIIYRINKSILGKSKLKNIFGKPLYKNVTIRNCNTARKLLELSS